MNKTYIAPSVEIVNINVEQIIAASVQPGIPGEFVDTKEETTSEWNIWGDETEE